jgi:hypothetical protein
LQQVDVEVLDTVFMEKIILKIALPEANRARFETLLNELPAQGV